MTLELYNRGIFTIKKLFLFITLTSFLSVSVEGNEKEPHPVWLQNTFVTIDQLSIKDPSLALEHAKQVLAENKQKLAPFGKATLFTKMAQQCYFLGYLTQSKLYIEQAYALSPDLTTETGILLLLVNGAIIDEQGSASEAMALFQQAEHYAKLTENKEMLADTYGYMANSFAIRHNNIKALQYFHQSYMLLKQLNDQLELAYLKVQMSKSYSYLNDDDKAISFAQEAIQYFSAHQLYFDELFAQNALARSYTRIKAYKQAEASFLKVIDLSFKLKKENYAFLGYMGLAKVYNYTGQHKKARYFLEKYRTKSFSTLTNYEKVDNYLLEARIELKDGELSLAEKSLALAEKMLNRIDQDKSLFWRIALLDLKTEISTAQGNFKLAYQQQKEARQLQKSYNNIEREKVRSKYKVMFDIDQALLKNEILIKNNQLDKIALENSKQKQWIQMLIIVTVSLLALILSFFIYRQIKTSQTLHKLANTDSLTELANRRFVFSVAEEQMGEAIKSQQTFSIIVFDIDHFKRVNDTYGHTTGDLALTTVASVAGKYVRNQDILGRIGGEEFLLVLPQTSSDQAVEIAQRIRAAIASKDITIKDNIIHITASFGIAQINDTHSNFNQLFNEADLALYQAKELGRNRVVIAEK